jgi:hypothetical protein
VNGLEETPSDPDQLGRRVKVVARSVGETLPLPYSLDDRCDRCNGDDALTWNADDKRSATH